MEDKIYLLSIEELLEGENYEEYLASALSKVDSDRRQRAERMKQRKAKAACVGAGLLLQLAVREALEAWRHEEAVIGSQTAEPACGKVQQWPKELYSMDLMESPGAEDLDDIRDVGRQRYCTVPELLSSIPEPLPLTYEYGNNGKPYFKGYPFFFNLSHSGSYVLCVLSQAEVGVDLQQHRSGAGKRLADRFFAKEELETLGKCESEAEQEALFYRLWTRKEACGKLTGQGIGAALGVNMLPGEPISVDGKPVCWEEYKEPSGYSLAVCKYQSEELPVTREKGK